MSVLVLIHLIERRDADLVVLFPAFMASRQCCGNGGPAAESSQEWTLYAERTGGISQWTHVDSEPRGGGSSMPERRGKDGSGVTSSGRKFQFVILLFICFCDTFVKNLYTIKSCANL